MKPLAGTRRLATPRPASVRTNRHGAPVAIDGVAVERATEEWVVEDRWWEDRPLRRRYFELVLANGLNTVVFHAGGHGDGWFFQRC